MMGWLRELPDGALGVMVAGAAWFGTAYWLSDRAMVAEASETLLPSCVSQLEDEQERALSRASEHAEQDRANKVDDLQSNIRRKESRLRDLRATLNQYREFSHLYNGSGLGALVQMPMAGMPTEDDLKAAEAEIANLKAALTKLPSISFPRVPSRELRETCTCAMMEALGDKRTDYALSLASFRLIAPQAVTSAKSDMASALRWDACGAKPWREF